MNIKVADQAWIALAFLEMEHPDREDFRSEEVLERAKAEFGALQPGVRQHLGSHAVASLAPTPGRYRMFTRTGHGRIRLYRKGDKVHPERTQKFVPKREDIPQQYWHLLDWYHGRRGSAKPIAPGASSDPRAFLALIGLIPAYDLRLMENAIEQDCERIEEDSEGVDVA